MMLNNKNEKIVLAAMMFMLYSSAVSAAPGVDTMFANFGDSTKQIVALIAGYVAPAVGLFFLGKSALTLKEYSESGGRVNIKAPLTQAAVGALLISFWGTVNIATETLSLGASSGMDVMSDTPAGAPAGMSAAITGVLLFVKMVGVISVFRGLFMLKASAEGSQQASIGKAMTHIFFGGAAVNINQTVSMLANSIGMPVSI